MIFSEEEQSQIKKLGDKNELINKLWEEYSELTTDGSKMLFVSFNKALKEISEKMDDHSLTTSDPWFNAVMEIGKSGEKLFNTSSKGKFERENNGDDLIKQKKLAKGSDIAI